MNYAEYLFCAPYNPPLKELLENSTYNLKSKWEQTHVNSLALKTKLTKDIVERDRECSSHADLEVQTLETADLGSVLACAWLSSSGRTGLEAVLQASRSNIVAFYPEESSLIPDIILIYDLFLICQSNIIYNINIIHFIYTCMYRPTLLQINYDRHRIFHFGRAVSSTHNILFTHIILTLIVPSANSVSPLKIAIANRLIHAIHKNGIVYLFL